MTVYDNIAFGLRRRKLSKAQIDEKVKEAAKILDLESQLKKKPKELSGGQKQRVAMGAAIVRNPKVFLMDEPLSNLDAKLRVQMRLEIAQLHERLGATIIYVTHDQTEAMTLGTRIVVMKDGVIQQVDTPDNLYANPANLFVAGFIGSPQMNFMDVTVREDEEDICLQLGDMLLPLPKDKRKKLQGKGYQDKEVILGIRPEDIKDSEIFINTFPRWMVEADVQVYELLGAEALLHFEYAGSRLVASVHSRTICLTRRPSKRSSDGIHKARQNEYDGMKRQKARRRENEGSIFDKAREDGDRGRKEAKGRAGKCAGQGRI